MQKPSLQFKLLSNISLVLVFQSAMFFLAMTFELSPLWMIPLTLFISIVILRIFIAQFLHPIRDVMVALEGGLTLLKIKILVSLLKMMNIGSFR
ncbi:MAG: hypothetical protein HRT38_13645 [Alteromonadaceae bacterium]|nr:hypothetical protein [Alteromonadaceae bacterium]